MKRKLQPKSDPIIAEEILEQAKRSILSDQMKKAVQCSVCGAESSSIAGEPLCWVCRRLKISAWREVEQQMPLQE